MPEIRLADPVAFDGWRAPARRLAAAGTAPEAVAWRVGEAGQPGLFDGVAPEAGEGGAALKVPLRFLLLAKRVVLHADPGRFDLLYRLLWRLTRGERRL